MLAGYLYLFINNVLTIVYDWTSYYRTNCIPHLYPGQQTAQTPPPLLPAAAPASHTALSEHHGQSEDEWTHTLNTMKVPVPQYSGITLHPERPDAS